MRLLDLKVRAARFAGLAKAAAPGRVGKRRLSYVTNKEKIAFMMVA
jgi:hypothetical protein